MDDTTEPDNVIPTDEQARALQDSLYGPSSEKPNIPRRVQAESPGNQTDVVKQMTDDAAARLRDSNNLLNASSLTARNPPGYGKGTAPVLKDLGAGAPYGQWNQ
jgi:hypothetical protein